MEARLMASIGSPGPEVLMTPNNNNRLLNEKRSIKILVTGMFIYYPNTDHAHPSRNQN